MNYQKIHDAIIDRSRGREYIPGVHHRHHIVPKCIGGTDDPSNIAVLTFREHFIIHHLLTKINNDPKLVFAFNAITNKWHATLPKITSRAYSQLKQSFGKLISEHHRGWVNARDSNNNLVRVTSEEYRNRNDLTFHTTSKVACVDTRTNKTVWVTSEEYKNTDFLISQVSINVDTAKYNFVNTATGECVAMTKKQARELNSQHRLNCYKQRIPVPAKLYKQLIDTSPNAGKSRHVRKGRPKNTAVAFDTITGSITLVDKETFDSNENLVGTTANMATVLDPETNTYIKIDKNIAKERRLRGPNVGKVNSINANTGERKQIQKPASADWVPLSIRSLYISPGVHYLEVKHGLKSANITNDQREKFEQIISNRRSSCG